MKSPESLFTAISVMSSLFPGHLKSMFEEQKSVEVDWEEVEKEYNLIKLKKSDLSRKEREQIVWLWEKRDANT